MHQPDIKADDGYEARLAKELDIYAQCLDVNALPEIFHYWSNKYVRPMLEEFGASNPDEFFAKYLVDSAKRSARARPTFVSVGAGNCDTEVRIAKIIRDKHGLTDFRIECLDINRTMLDRGLEYAASEGVTAHISAVIGDFNDWKPSRTYGGAMANQSLHHVLNLEGLFSSIKDALTDDAAFVVSDMIGRNGHMRWPEALAAVQEFWKLLPDEYRYNRVLKRHEPVYENWDCSKEGFEGIRAQDILPLLTRYFEFEVYVGFGNVVDVFVDRNFGHNFDAASDRDKALIDRIHAYDEEGFAAGTLTPTHMLAVLRKQPVRSMHSRGLSPAASVRNAGEDSLTARAQWQSVDQAGTDVQAAPAVAKDAGIEKEIRELIRLGQKYKWSQEPTRARLEQHGVNLVRTDIYSESPTITDIRASFEYAGATNPDDASAVFDDSGIFDDVAVESFARELMPYCATMHFPADEIADGFYWRNPQFAPSDAMVLYAMIRRFRPKTVIEIGSGYSTHVMHSAISALGSDTRLLCIDPQPRADISNLKGIDFQRRTLQQFPVDAINDLLHDGDMVFYDGSHTLKTGSDTVYFYLKVLPYLRSGVFVHAHDVRLPYPRNIEGLLKSKIYWGEQYLLMAHLHNTARYQVLYASELLRRRSPEVVAEAMSQHQLGWGSSLWFLIKEGNRQ